MAVCWLSARTCSADARRSMRGVMERATNKSREFSRALIIAVLLASLQAGCLRNPLGLWVLESYDAQAGYKVRKDGVYYDVRCLGHYYTPKKSATPTEKLLAIPPGAELQGLPSPTKPQNSCAGILPFLHKSVPLEQSGDVLLFREDSSTIEFMVVEAKEEESKTMEPWLSILGGGLAAAILTILFSVWWDRKKQEITEDWEFRRYQANQIHFATWGVGGTIFCHQN